MLEFCSMLTPVIQITEIEHYGSLSLWNCTVCIRHGVLDHIYLEVARIYRKILTFNAHCKLEAGYVDSWVWVVLKLLRVRNVYLVGHSHQRLEEDDW